MKSKLEIFDYLKQFLTEERLRKIEYFAPKSSNYVLPVLEDVYQYRNAAAIVRSAEACGFHKVVALEKENIFNPNLKVTKGADTWVEVDKVPSNLQSLKKIKNNGYKVVAVSLENNAVFLPDFQMTEPTALVFGTELEGVSEEILSFADQTLAIPMYGFTKSFNVSVAAAICMYDLKQKLIHSSLDYLLKGEELMDLKIKWAVNSIRSGQEIYDDYLKKNLLS